LVFACPSIGPCASSVPPEPYPSAPPGGCTDERRSCGGAVVGIWAPRTRRTRPLGVVPVAGPAGADGPSSAGPDGPGGPPTAGPPGVDGPSPRPPAPAAGRRCGSGGRSGSAAGRAPPPRAGGAGHDRVADDGRAGSGIGPGGAPPPSGLPAPGAPASGDGVPARWAGLPVTWRMLASTWVSRGAGRVTPRSVLPRGDRLTRPLAVRAGGAGSGSRAGGSPAWAPTAGAGGTSAPGGPQPGAAGVGPPWARSGVGASAVPGSGGGQPYPDPLAAAVPSAPTPSGPAPSAGVPWGGVTGAARLVVSVVRRVGGSSTVAVMPVPGELSRRTLMLWRAARLPAT